MIEKYVPYTVADVKRESSKNLFSVVSCFAGGGGSSTGYRLAGGNVLLINEFVEEAISSYKENYPDTPILVDDIKKYSGQDFLNIADLKVGELDILDGSPPCSAFSVSGKGEKGWVGYVSDTRKSYFNDDGEIVHEGELKTNDGVKKYSDDKVQEGIEDLFLEYIRIAKDIQPKVIVAENVKGITMGPAKAKLVEFINAFDSIGYQVTYKVMNASDFGTAQNRERTIFVCIRNDVFDAIDMNVLSLNSIFPAKTSIKLPMEDAICDVENDPEEIQMLLDYVQKGYQKFYIENLPFRPLKTTNPGEPEFRSWNPKGSCFNMKRPAPSLPCPTLTQMGQQVTTSGVFHYEFNRKFTIPELKRLMGLPEDYTLTGTFNQKAERIGRMVAPKMMAELSKSIYENVLKVYYESVEKSDKRS